MNKINLNRVINLLKTFKSNKAIAYHFKLIINKVFVLFIKIISKILLKVQSF